MGNVLTLSRSQIDALDVRMGAPAAGCRFLRAPFSALGVLRWAQLFDGALACLGLLLGARRWLGRSGAGEVAFSFGAIAPSLRMMPAHLVRAMPMLVLGVVALA